MPRPKPKFPERVTRPRSSAGAPGKGDTPRIGIDREKYERNWDNIDWRMAIPVLNRSLEPLPPIPIGKNRPSTSSAFERWWRNPTNQPWNPGQLGLRLEVTKFLSVLAALEPWMRRAFEAGQRTR